MVFGLMDPRLLAWRLACRAGVGRARARLVFGASLLLDPCDPVHRELLVFGVREPWFTRVVASLVRFLAPRVVVDVGANVGYYVALYHALHQRGPWREEPLPRLAFTRAWGDVGIFVAQMRLQKLLLDLVDSMPPGGPRVEAMKMLSPKLYESFLRDSIKLSDVLESLAANPRLLGVIAPGLAGLAARLLAG